MKNKGFKYILVVLALIMTLLISINFDRIKFALSLFDIYRKTTTRTIIDDNDENIPPTMAENPLEKILEEGADTEKTPVDKNPSNDNSPPADNTPTSLVNNPPRDNKSSSGNTKPIDKSTDESPVVEPIKESKISITERYNKKFMALQAEFENTLSGLVNSAYAQYSSGAFSKSELATRYLDQGVATEKSADSRFYALLKEYEKELKANSYDTSIVKEVANYYESFKSSRKSEIISKGMGMVNK